MATYSFINFQVTLTGPGADGGIVMGYGVGAATEGMTVDMNEDKNAMAVGADGTPMHSLRANSAATITLRLQKTSPANRTLSDLYSLQTNPTSGGLFHGRNVITLTDVVRGDSYTASQVAFRRFPSNTWAENAGNVEWTFDAGICHPLLGEGIGPVEAP